MIGNKMGSSLARVTIWLGLLWWRTSNMVEKMIWLSTLQHFLLGEFSGGQVFWATSNPRARNSTSRELQREANRKNVYFPSCPPYQLFSQITLPWVEILDWPLSYLNYWVIEGKWPRTCPEGDVATWVECGRRGQCSKQSDNCVPSMNV